MQGLPYKAGLNYNTESGKGREWPKKSTKYEHTKTSGIVYTIGNRTLYKALNDWQLTFSCEFGAPKKIAVTISRCKCGSQKNGQPSLLYPYKLA